MRPFGSLTQRGKARRLGRLARGGLGAWGLDGARLRLLAFHTNAVFRVDAPDGRRFALRVYSPWAGLDAQIHAETTWMQALAELDPALGSPRVIATAAGELAPTFASPGVDTPRRCMLASWVPGRALGPEATVAQYLRLGRLSARMHDHGEQWTRPPGFAPLPWDKTFYFAGDRVVIFEPEFDGLFPDEIRAALKVGIDRCQAAFDRVAGMGQQIVLHGDLHPWNVHRLRDRLFPLDFGDLTIGHPLQDIAVTLFYLNRRADHGDLCAAFVAGYTESRPWPVSDPTLLTTLQHARGLNFINYIARCLPDYHETLPERCSRIARWVGADGPSE